MTSCGEKETKNPAEDDSSEYGIINGHEYVDLGLPSGLKWAACNVGASLPWENGTQFAWGYLTDHAEDHLDDFVTLGMDLGDISENVAYDAARANWGGSWRMPKAAEMRELLKECTLEFIEKEGHNGFLVTGPNGNQLFLPMVGMRSGKWPTGEGVLALYWASTPDGKDFDQSYGLFLSHLEGQNELKVVVPQFRYMGGAIRPVSD